MLGAVRVLDHVVGEVLAGRGDDGAGVVGGLAGDGSPGAGIAEVGEHDVGGGTIEGDTGGRLRSVAADHEQPWRLGLGAPKAERHAPEPLVAAGQPGDAPGRLLLPRRGVSPGVRVERGEIDRRERGHGAPLWIRLSGARARQGTARVC